MVLFLALKHIKYREAWNSPTASCFIFYMPLYNGTCYTEQISQYISLRFPFHSSIWDISLLFHDIRVRLLGDAVHNSRSANFFNLTGAKNSSNVRCCSTFVKQHQALSHCTGEGNLHPPRFGSPRFLWGCLGFFFPVPENKSTSTIQSYVLPCQTHPETQWDEEEPSPSKVPVVFNAPPNRHS